MENLWRDLRLGLRQLARRPGFAAAAILTLALGIGATAAMFTVVDAVLLNELPYRDASRLVVLTGTFEEKGEIKDWPVSQMDFEDWRQQNSVFEEMSVYSPGDFAINLELGSGGAQDAERLNGELVSQSYFPLLGVRPAAGRFFTPQEDSRPMEDYVTVLGYDLWQRSFGGDPSIVGRQVQVNGRPYLVVGVAPKGFRGLTDTADLWVPSQVPPKPFYLTSRRLRWLEVVARLQPGATVEQAQAEMTRIAEILEREYPDMNAGVGVKVTGLRDHWFGPLRIGLLVLTAGACVLLVIACINVANLLLTRAMAEQRAYAIRMSLGANRGRLLRQLLTQSILLSVIGAALGLLLAQWATPALLALSGARFQSFVDVSPGPEVIAAIVGVALLCGALFGLVPVWITFQADLAHSLTRQGQQPMKGFGRQRFQNAVVVAQVALALFLSVCAGLMARGFQKAIDQDLGFNPENVLTWRIDMRGDRYAEDEPVVRLVREYLDRLAAVPGVEQVEMSNPTIPTDEWTGAYILYEDHRSDAPDGTYPQVMHSVSPGYFDLLDIPVVQGRVFTRQDDQSFGVVVSKALADEHWPGQNPLGKRLKNGARPDSPWLSVIGVVAEVRHQGLLADEQPAADIYLPILQLPWRPLTMSFLVRPRADSAPHSLMPALRREMRAVSPDLPVYDVATLEERLSGQTARARFQIILVSLFTLMALVLASVGIYGVVAYSTAQRTREIAIRMSLGADRGSVLRMVVGRGAALAALGLLLGLVAVTLVSRRLVSLLHGVSATDPLILGGAALVLFLVTLAANYFPARRAAKLEPVTGLRAD
ncbi:MAG TPA: ABC transporter permease [Thermoanaerobaculia bacterium]|nr:ABC transporter permease [Thermoanaerobaculia bacterium]